MGGSSWSDDFYTAKVADKKLRGVDTFAYDTDVKAGRVAAKAHNKLDPKGVIRESRDSTEHPESLAIGVLLDVTGSMSTVPVTLQKKLPQLMGLLIRKGYVKDPQILFGAIGDFYADRIPLQIGQFESGVEMDDDLTNIVLEAGGGGSYQESYQNGLYFFAKKTSTDCFEKRGAKGYLFLIGDEMAYPKASRAELSELMGEAVQDDVPTEQIVQMCREKWNVFFIIPKGTSHFGDPKLRAYWDGLLGSQSVLMLEDPASVCETIATAIGICEGTTDLDGAAGDLSAAGTAGHIVKDVTNALAPLANSTSLARGGSGDLPERSGGTSRV